MTLTDNHFLSVTTLEANPMNKYMRCVCVCVLEFTSNSIFFPNFVTKRVLNKTILL